MCVCAVVAGDVPIEEEFFFYDFATPVDSGSPEESSSTQRRPVEATSVDLVGPSIDSAAAVGSGSGVAAEATGTAADSTTAVVSTEKSTDEEGTCVGVDPTALVTIKEEVEVQASVEKAESTTSTGAPTQTTDQFSKWNKKKGSLPFEQTVCVSV